MLMARGTLGDVLVAQGWIDDAERCYHDCLEWLGPPASQVSGSPSQSQSEMNIKECNDVDDCDQLDASTRERASSRAALISCLGDVALRREDWNRARKLGEVALRIAGTLSHHRLLAKSNYLIGYSRMRLRQGDRGRNALEAALREARKGRLVGSEAYSVLALADLDMENLMFACTEQIKPDAQDSISQRSTHGDTSNHGAHLTDHGALDENQGFCFKHFREGSEFVESRNIIFTRYKHGIELAKSIGDGQCEAFGLQLFGQAHLASANSKFEQLRGKEALLSSIRLCLEMGDILGYASTIETLVRFLKKNDGEHRKFIGHDETGPELNITELEKTAGELRLILKSGRDSNFNSTRLPNLREVLLSSTRSETQETCKSSAISHSEDVSSHGDLSRPASLFPAASPTP
mmetsp:Transcript_66941/g.178962  ORF Transcript_66941/g.178962 Transcript_66941/m.178962 type:complete len:407 (-) Transcript_66941:315-1535(-)